MIRLLNNTLFIIITLLLHTTLYATHLPGDSLLDNYVNGLHTAIKEKVKINQQTGAKDFLLVYNDPEGKFVTDFVNNGKYFWFINTDQETQIRKLANDIQAQTGGEQLYVALASVYNYADVEMVNSKISWSTKEKYKPAAHQSYNNDKIWSTIIPKIRSRKGLPQGTAVLYIISYFTVDEKGAYKVSHKCFYTGSTSLNENGFQLNAEDHVMKGNKTANDLSSNRVAFLAKTIKAAAASMSQFSEEIKRVNELFAKLPANSPGKKFYDDYNGYCTDKLVIKQTALLIDSIGYEAYNAYMSDKKTADSYQPYVFRSFYASLKAFNETYKKISSELPDVKNAGDLVKKLNALTSSELGVLQYTERINAIKLLNKLKELTDHSWWQVLNTNRWVNVVRSDDNTSKIVVKSEELMVALISSTPDSQQPSLIAELKGNDNKYTLLLEVFKKIDDEPLGEANYSDLMEVLAAMIVKNTDMAALDNLYSKNRIYSWSEGKMRNILDDEAGTHKSELTIGGTLFSLAPQYQFFEYVAVFDEAMGATLQKYGITQPFDVNLDGSFKPRACSTGCLTRLRVIGGDDPLAPFDLIAIIPSEQINFNTGFSVEADQITLLPGFFLQWYLHKKKNKEIKHNVNMTLAAVSVATGVGGWVAAASLGARLFILAETFFTLTAIAGEEYPQFNNFMKENLGPTGYQIFKTVEFGVIMFSAGKGMVGLGKSAFNTAKRLSMSFLNVIKNRPDFLAKLRLLYPDKFKKLAAWMLDKNLGGVDLAALAGKVQTDYRGLDFLKDLNISLDVADESVAFRASRFKNGDDVWRDPDMSFMEPGPGTSGGTSGGGTGGGNTGGGGTATTAEAIMVRQTQNMAPKFQVDASLSQQLAAKQMLTVMDKAMTYAEVSTYSENLAEVLKAAQAAKKAAKLKVLQNVTGTAKAVIVAVEEADYVVYAQGEVKPLVEAYVKAKEKEKEKNCTLCSTEPLICELDKKSDYTNKTQALTALCKQVPPLILKEVCVKLLTLERTDLNTFLADVINNSPIPTCNGNYTFLAQSIRILTPGIVAAWKNYVNANRTCLRVSMYHLRKMDAAWNNPSVHQAPFSFTEDDFMLIARAARQNSTNSNVRYFAGNYDSTVFDNIQSFCRLQATFVNMDKLKAKLQQENSGPSLEGVNFTIKYMGEHPSMFNGQTLKFEDPEESDGRDVDVLGVGGTEDDHIFYEFKSVKTFELKYAKQFVKDLRNANDLDQIKWIFDSKKMDSGRLLEEVTGQMTKPEIRAMLNNLDLAKKQMLFKGYTAAMGTPTEAQVEAFIRINFNFIFTCSH